MLFIMNGQHSMNFKFKHTKKAQLDNFWLGFFVYVVMFKM
ncbi:hypothetical protein PB1E_1355 [Leuconostoc gelidum subsp. gasicomitatum]|nr:hypothetical protein PB1E_1355 [Leuconostoc gasicomitatum]